MKKIILFLFTTFQLQAQNSLLWEISGKDLQQPSYLLGTMHIMCKDDFEIKDKVKNALAQSQKLYLEIDMSSPEIMQKMGSMSIGKQTLSSQLNEQQKQRLNAVLPAYGLSLNQIEMLSPQALYGLLLYKSLNCSPDQFKLYEMELIQMAQKLKLGIDGLETIDFQMDLFEKMYTIDATLEALEHSEDYKVIFNNLVNAFKIENLEELDELVRNPKFMAPEQEESMLTLRNLNWVEQMPEIMQKQSTTFAVGSGHLSGKNGVISLLQQKGYTLKPIIK